MNIKGYEDILRLVEIGEVDSFDFYYGFFVYNFNVVQEVNLFMNLVFVVVFYNFYFLVVFWNRYDECGIIRVMV